MQALHAHFLLLGFCFCLCLCFQGTVATADNEASEFREFTNKQGQQIEARIESISDDLRLLNLERRDGKTFTLAINGLSLDDQQFLREWLQPSNSDPAGKVKVFGELPDDKPIHVDALAGVDDITSIHASKRGWLVLRKSGEVVSFEEEFPGLTGVEHLSVNTVWIYLTKQNGKVGGAKGGLHHPEIITDAIQCVGGNGHSAALLRDGTVTVWGRDYQARQPVDPPQPLSNIVHLASSQDRIAAVHRDGRVFSWASGKAEVFEAMLGDGVVEIEGSIFDHLALTRSGEVYTWNKADVTKARIPVVLKGEGPFKKVRCNGATRAAQREDGSWIAWGRNSSGIVDHINALGPVSDLAFFSEPGKQEKGYVIWREP